MKGATGRTASFISLNKKYLKYKIATVLCACYFLWYQIVIVLYTVSAVKVV